VVSAPTGTEADGPGSPHRDARGEAAGRSGLTAEVHPSSPYRRPDWRWRLVRHLAGSPLTPLWRCADTAVLRALDHLGRLDCCRTPDERARAAARDPDVGAAAALAAGGPSDLTAEVEARLLAAQDDAAIAARVGLPAGVVAAYADLFFDVRPRLRARSYVYHTVLAPLDDLGDGPADRARLWRFFGYAGGPAVLDAVLDATRGGTAAGGGLRARVDLLVAALRLPAAGAAGLKAVALAQRLDALEREGLPRHAGSVFVPVAAGSDVPAGWAPDGPGAATAAPQVPPPAATRERAAPPRARPAVAV